MPVRLDALSMIAVAAVAATGSPAAVLAVFTVAAFFATCAWVSAYPTFSERFPTHLRATGIGASVAVGRVGAVIGQVLLAATAAALNLTSMFVLLGAFWLIGAVAGGTWWRFGVEGRGQNLEQLAGATAGRA